MAIGAKQLPKHLFFKRCVKATDDYSTSLDLLRNTFEGCKGDIAGAFAGNDETKHWLVEKRSIAIAYYSRIIIRSDAPGAEITGMSAVFIIPRQRLLYGT
jgi:hypothetical protein